MNENNTNNQSPNSGFDIFASIGAIFMTMGMIFAIMIVLASIMRPFGFKGDSIYSILFFFSFSLLISFPFQEIAIFISNFLMYYKKLSRNTAKKIFMVLSILTNYTAISIVNNLISTVVATNLSILVISFVIAFLTVK